MGSICRWRGICCAVRSPRRAGTGRRAVGLGALGRHLVASPGGGDGARLAEVLIAVLALSLVRKRRIGPVWLTMTRLRGGLECRSFLMRSSPFTALGWPDPPVLPDLVVVLALLPRRRASGHFNQRRHRWLDASPAPSRCDSHASAVFDATSSLYSTATFLASWRDNLRGYLKNAQASLAAAASVRHTGSGSRSAGVTGNSGGQYESHISPCCASTEFATTTTQLECSPALVGWSTRK